MQSPTCLIKNKVESLGDFLDTSCSQRNLNRVTEGPACGRKQGLTSYLRKEVALHKDSRAALRAHIALHPLA